MGHLYQIALIGTGNVVRFASEVVRGYGEASRIEQAVWAAPGERVTITDCSRGAVISERQNHIVEAS